jgi:hypothetical protein
MWPKCQFVAFFADEVKIQTKSGEILTAVTKEAKILRHSTLWLAFRAPHLFKDLRKPEAEIDRLSRHVSSGSACPRVDWTAENDDFA